MSVGSRESRPDKYGIITSKRITGNGNVYYASCAWTGRNNCMQDKIYHPSIGYIIVGRDFTMPSWSGVQIGFWPRKNPRWGEYRFKYNFRWKFPEAWQL